MCRGFDLSSSSKLIVRVSCGNLPPYESHGDLRTVAEGIEVVMEQILLSNDVRIEFRLPKSLLGGEVARRSCCNRVTPRAT